MRLRVFTGRTVHEAMRALRQALGDDAVILSTEESADGVRLTAGIEVAADPLQEILGTPAPIELVERLALVLSFHQAGRRRIERLCVTARQGGSGEAENVLACALAEHYRFAPLGDGSDRPLVLAGGPGVGKTLMVARLAAAARLAGRSVRVASTDRERKGGTAQLEALLAALAVALEDVSALEQPAAAAGALVLVDAAAVEPLRPETLAATAALARRLGGELVPVLPADLMPAEAHDQAHAWRALGATRFLASRLDVARRLGMLLAAADAGLALAGVGISPFVAEPVKVITSTTLARLLLYRAGAFAGEGRP
jgi:flagellar biosynthesis protein FlhF